MTNEYPELPAEDRIPSFMEPGALKFNLDGVVHETMIFEGLTELEAVFVALLTSYEGLAMALVTTWKNQGLGPTLEISPSGIEAMTEAIVWAREKAIDLIPALSAPEAEND